jgi:hypothetical protein
LGKALAGAIDPQPELWQFALYNSYQTGLLPFRVLFPLPENGPCSTLEVTGKARLEHLGRCMMYPSQWKTWAVLLPAVVLRYQLSSEQTLQPVLAERLRQKPHAGRLLYERRGWTTWEEQMDKSRNFRERHLLA